jgi:hypothetical protein
MRSSWYREALICCNMRVLCEIRVTKECGLAESCFKAEAGPLDLVICLTFSHANE